MLSTIAHVLQAVLPGEDSPTDPTVIHSIQMNLSVLTFLLGTGIPLVVGWLKRQTLAKHWQVVLMLVVNLVVAFLRQVLNNKGLIDAQLARDFFGQVVTSGIGYNFIVKPFGLDDIGQGVIGPKPAPADPETGNIGLAP